MMDVVPLGVIPEISLSNKDLNYGIDIEKVFWRRQGILDQDLLRRSRDEEIIATLIGSFLLDRPIAVITSTVLDNLAMSKTPHTQYLCMFARHGNLFYHSKFIVTTSSKWYN